MLADLVREFYRLRAAGDRAGIAQLLAAGVEWTEPEIGDHLGRLVGRDAVLDMMARAAATTGGTFRLDVAATTETARHCAAVIRWHAVKGARAIDGEELAVFEIDDGRIVRARFFAANLADDEAFWATPER